MVRLAVYHKDGNKTDDKSKQTISFSSFVTDALSRWTHNPSYTLLFTWTNHDTPALSFGHSWESVYLVHIRTKLLERHSQHMPKKKTPFLAPSISQTFRFLEPINFRFPWIHFSVILLPIS